ncbi:MAG: hypothetical protein QM535_06070 [Limnohabitans sp.]|nr:hypothetical protein [Limnohabitans sp.]
MNPKKLEFQFIAIEPQKEVILENKPIIHYKNSRRHKVKIEITREAYEEKKIVWCLSKFIRKADVSTDTDWVYQGSEEKLSNGLTAMELADFLNSKNPFDFDYQPQNNDLLTINLKYVVLGIKNKYSRPYIGSYISLIFNDGKWNTNKGYDHLHFIYEDFKQGEIKELHL